jgi:hypothetical protein
LFYVLFGAHAFDFVSLFLREGKQLAYSQANANVGRRKEREESSAIMQAIS